MENLEPPASAVEYADLEERLAEVAWSYHVQQPWGTLSVSAGMEQECSLVPFTDVPAGRAPELSVDKHRRIPAVELLFVNANEISGPPQPESCKVEAVAGRRPGIVSAALVTGGLTEEKLQSLFDINVNTWAQQTGMPVDILVGQMGGVAAIKAEVRTQFPNYVVHALAGLTGPAIVEDMAENMKRVDVEQNTKQIRRIHALGGLIVLSSIVTSSILSIRTGEASWGIAVGASGSAWVLEKKGIETAIRVTDQLAESRPLDLARTVGEIYTSVHDMLCRNHVNAQLFEATGFSPGSFNEM
jgi:hypothetical protein